jgi:hypothetical protein
LVEGELPRFYGQPVLFGIARDPSTLFVYWEIDWPKLFEENMPVDRTVYLRVSQNNSSTEFRVAVEPFAGHHYVSVSEARAVYRIELGYEMAAGVWNCVASSNEIATPPDDVFSSADIEIATVPFHLSFQHMIDRVRASTGGDKLVDVVSRLQARADNDNDLTKEEHELLRAIESGSAGGNAAQRARLRKFEEVFASRRKIKSMLGADGSSRTSS